MFSKLTKQLYGTEHYREATSCEATQWSSSTSWNPKVHHWIHKTYSLVPILRQTNPVHTTPSCLSKIHLNIILPPPPWSFLVSSFPLAFLPITYTYSSSPSICYSYMPRPSHSPRLDYCNYTWRRAHIKTLLGMQLSSSSRHLIPPRPKYLPQNPVLKHHQPLFILQY
jgi:hypothetical protein